MCKSCVEEAFFVCFEGRLPKEDKELYAFYLSICTLQRSIKEAAASMLLEEDVDEVFLRNYQREKEDMIETIYQSFKKYFKHLKGYSNESEYLTWIRNMSDTMKDDIVFDNADNYSLWLHNMIFAKT